MESGSDHQRKPAYGTKDAAQQEPRSSRSRSEDVTLVRAELGTAEALLLRLSPEASELVLFLGIIISDEYNITDMQTILARSQLRII